MDYINHINELFTDPMYKEKPRQHYKWDVFFGRSTVQGTKSFGFCDADDQSKIMGASIFTHHLMSAFRESSKEMVSN
jgi:hypothetical protein